MCHPQIFCAFKHRIEPPTFEKESQMVTHPKTDQAGHCLTSVINQKDLPSSHEVYR